MTAGKGSNKIDSTQRHAREQPIQERKDKCRRTIKEAITGKKEGGRKREVMAGYIWGLLVFGQRGETCQVMASRHTHTHTHTRTHTHTHTHTYSCTLIRCRNLTRRLSVCGCVCIYQRPFLSHTQEGLTSSANESEAS